MKAANVPHIPRITPAGAQKQPDELSVIRTTRGFRQQQSLQVVSLLQQARPLAQVASLQDNAPLPAGYDATLSGDETGVICALPRQRRVVCFEQAELRHLQLLRTGQKGPVWFPQKEM